MRFSARLALPALAALTAGIPGASAQNIQILAPNLPGCNWTTGKLTASCIPIFIGHLVQTLFSLISVFFLINVMYAGYQIAMGAWSGENTAGKDRLRHSIIGLIVSVCCYLILDLIISIIAPS